MPGRTSSILNIPIGSGKASLQVEFTKGCVDRKNYKPATYRSENEVEQAIIENSAYFGAQIVIVRTIDNDPVAKKVETEAPVVTQEFPDATSWEEVVAILKENGAKATQYRTQSIAAKFAASHGLVFPNYTFED